MSCTAPINITYVSNTCDSKCDFKANYSDSTCVVTNMADYITCSYDANSAQSITLNTTTYTVSEVRIYSPSLHMFNGAYVDAEFIIMHTAPSNFENLLVCIPVTISKPNNVNKMASSDVSYIMTASSTCETSTGCNVLFNGISTYNLNNYIPVGVPFYTYNGTFPWCDTSSGNVDYIVFDPDSFNIACSQEDINNIPKNSYTISKTVPALFINSKGVAGNSSGGGNVYIDCVPVETSTDDTTMYSSVSAMPLTLSLPTVDMSMMWKILSTFTAIIVIIILIVAYYKVVAIFKIKTD